jgi:uroporphyrinogen-III synthase
LIDAIKKRNPYLIDMVKNGVNTHTLTSMVKSILITQPRPDTEKSPYFELARKYDVALDFHPFIRVEGISAKEFRKQKIEIPGYTAVYLPAETPLIISSACARK